MLNHPKSVVYGFSLFPRLVGFEFVGKLASVGAVFRTLFFGAGNSENCLNQYLGKREVRAAGSIRSFFGFICQISKSDFQNYEPSQFFGFRLLFVN
ncbi:hypothetical protein [Vibrio navarrensis]|uniref:hypothetical protein n=1 Tax=Vibrio navarrensis TaxID=29495 RepID=UPI0018693605|nr:hypothetical protein [Vibrio navarrensis]